MNKIIILIILLLNIYCSSMFEKNWKSTNKEMFQFIKVNLGNIESSTEIRSSSIIRLQLFGNEKKIENVYPIVLSELKGLEKFKFDSGQFSIKGNKYRGELEVSFEPKIGKFIFINKLPLEEYLYGVVPSEMPASWSLEALKSQAVAARTYAVNAIQKTADSNYNIESTIQSQVYAGMKNETKNSNQAVDETKNKILIYAEKPIQAFYHSNSGGQTETADNVWGYSLGYLKSVRSIYCEKASNFKWTFRFTKKELLEKLKPLGVEEINSISILDNTLSGRVKTLEFLGKEKESVKVSAVDFRKAMGSAKIKSVFFEVDEVGDEFNFSGKGFGHGVGMSQWGSKGMADSGMSYKDILMHYYHETIVANID